MESNFSMVMTDLGLLTPQGIPATYGKVIFVDGDGGCDGNSGESMSAAVKSIAQGYSLLRTNKNDILAINGCSATYSLTAMSDVSKSRVHFVGLDGFGRTYGQGVKISLGVTTVAADIATMKNSGVRNSFRNIKFLNSNTVAEGIYGVAEVGEYTVYENCEFYKSTDLDVTTAAELLLNGDSCQFRNCTFGSLANAISGAILRPCVKLNRETVTGKVCRDCTFVNCMFWRKAGNTANCFISAPGATDVERQLLFKDCGFVNTKLAAALPAQAIIATAQTEGYIILDPLCYGVNVTKMSTSTGVIVTGAAPDSGTGIGVNAA